MSELHFRKNDHSFKCWWCGTPLFAVDGPGTAPSFTTDKAEWAASPACCEISNPVTTAIFDDPEQFSPYPFLEDKIKITKEELAKRIERVTPLIRSNDGTIRDFEWPSLHDAYTWGDKKLGDEVPIKEEIGTTATYHGCAYYGFAKPSIAEVLAQLPDGEGFERVNAFYIDMTVIKVCGDGAGHILKTVWVMI